MWSEEAEPLNATYTNNRNDSLGWQYDADGRNTLDEDGGETTFDAAGSLIKITNFESAELERFYAGDGTEVKRKQKYYRTFASGARWLIVAPQYFIRSSVLGGEVVTEANSTGGKLKTYVRAAGAIIAEQTYQAVYGGVEERLHFTHADATGISQRTLTNGTLVETQGTKYSPAELDPLGNNAGTINPYPDTPDVEPEPELPVHNYFGDYDPMQIDGQFAKCRAGSIMFDCRRAQKRMPNGSPMSDDVADYIFGSFAQGSGRFEEVFGESKGGEDDCVGGKCPPGAVNVYASQSTFVFVPSSAIVTWNTRRQTRQLAPLPPERDKAIRNALQELIDFLKKGKFSEDCQKNVIDKLNKIEEFSLDKFIKFLELGGDFYDGKQSSALAKTYAPKAGFNDTLTIAGAFDVRKGLEAITAYGSAVSKFTVFFKPKTIETEEKTSRLTGVKIAGITNDNIVFIFHEGLHGFGNSLGKVKGYYDDDTFKSGDIFDLKPRVSTDTSIISEHIRKNCFN